MIITTNSRLVEGRPIRFDGEGKHRRMNINKRDHKRVYIVQAVYATISCVGDETLRERQVGYAQN